ncbi:MAG: hypothetical protein WCS37_18395, partial [Chloroflexota bacterium]
MALKEVISNKGVQSTYLHAKCGGTVAGGEGEAVYAPDTDCPICAEVREFARLTGQVRATMGTPLAKELGLRVFTGQPGLA